MTTTASANNSSATDPATGKSLPRYADLNGKRALVTGAGRGIGRVCAETLAAQGVHVVLTARTPSEISEVAAAICEAGGSAEAVSFDAADLEEMNSALDSVGTVDILVNNAGTNKPQTFVDVDPDSFDRVMGVNVRGAFFVAQAVAQRLVAAGKPGSIVHMSSQMGHVGGENRTVYCASKHAIEGLTKAMAADLSKHGIRVNSVCPTFILTPMTEPFFDDPEFAAQVHAKILLGRTGQMQEVANAVTFLASDASSLMTGSAMMLDGGWTAV